MSQHGLHIDCFNVLDPLSISVFDNFIMKWLFRKIPRLGTSIQPGQWFVVVDGMTLQQDTHYRFNL